MELEAVKFDSSSHSTCCFASITISVEAELGSLGCVTDCTVEWTCDECGTHEPDISG